MSSSTSPFSSSILINPPKALLTDVFGTVVDWRSSVTTFLTQSAHSTLSSGRAVELSAKVRDAASNTDWADFAQQWRNSYYKFTREYQPADNGGRLLKTVDEHHRDALGELLVKNGLEGLWDKREIEEMSLVWHRLVPWPDSARGLGRLNELGFVTTTLSNGNKTLLEDLARFGDLPYKRILGAEDFGAYKPHPAVYEGAARELGLRVGECALVAAHLGDLLAARGCGYRTVYVERREEEGWGWERKERAREEEWVDMWVGVEEGGFEEVARRFGQNGRESGGR